MAKDHCHNRGRQEKEEKAGDQADNRLPGLFPQVPPGIPPLMLSSLLRRLAFRKPDRSARRGPRYCHTRDTIRPLISLDGRAATDLVRPNLLEHYSLRAATSIPEIASRLC